MTSLVENKKIRNATATTYNNINFKSKLEESIYKTLLSAGFKPDYEKLKFVLWEGFKPTVPFYNRSKSKVFKQETTKLQDITYTPDFTFKYKDLLVIVEVKGVENDTFPIKKKMFRKYLETLGIPCIFFEVRTKKEMLQSVEILKSYEHT